MTQAALHVFSCVQRLLHPTRTRRRGCDSSCRGAASAGVVADSGQLDDEPDAPSAASEHAIHWGPPQRRVRTREALQRERRLRGAQAKQRAATRGACRPALHPT